MSLSNQIDLDNQVIDITTKIYVQPLDKNTQINPIESSTHYSDDTSSKTATISQVSHLLDNKKQLNNEIEKMTRLIEKHKKTIKNIECDLWESCDHEWIYDECANFDDRTKYLCKICGCYRNQYWYIRRKY